MNQYIVLDYARLARLARGQDCFDCSFLLVDWLFRLMDSCLIICKKKHESSLCSDRSIWMSLINLNELLKHIGIIWKQWLHHSILNGLVQSMQLHLLATGYLHKMGSKEDFFSKPHLRNSLMDFFGVWRLWDWLPEVRGPLLVDES